MARFRGLVPWWIALLADTESIARVLIVLEFPFSVPTDLIELSQNAERISGIPNFDVLT